MTTPWLSVLPPLLTIALAIWSKRIIPSLLAGLLLGGYLLNSRITGGFETAVDQIVSTLTDAGSLQVLLFLYLFSGFIGIIKKSGGIEAFSALAGNHVASKQGVFSLLWALIPVTFIDCGFRVVGAGSIVRPLAEKHKIASERLAFMLNNTASPVVELIPIATTFVGFNLAIITLGLNSAGVSDQGSAYSIWLKAIPLEFFSLAVIGITLLSVFFNFRGGQKGHAAKAPHAAPAKSSMAMVPETPVITPRLMNLVLPMLTVIVLSIGFFWFLGSGQSTQSSFVGALTSVDPNRAMLIALFISLFLTGIFYAVQQYGIKEMTTDIISGGNEIMPTLAILALAWPLAAVSQELGLNVFIERLVGGSLPVWSVALTLFVLSSTVTYFIGSGWGAASLIMPFAIPLAVHVGASIPLCVAAVITGGTFGDVTSPVAGMTNMSSHIAHADHAKYLRYAAPYNFSAAGIAAILYVVAGLMS
ncbi:MAG: Na+/H+ antiporter NhaC family protein [Gemmatimonadota bacterium]